MKRLFSDNAASELTAAISDTDTTITLADASAFPEPGAGEFFPITLYALDAGKEINHEIMHCTGRSGNTLTVLRGQEGTTARAWDVETPAELRFTSEAARELVFPDAPSDGNQYARQDSSWALVDVTGAVDSHNSDDAAHGQTAFGRSVLTSVDSAAGRSVLGLGTAATEADTRYAHRSNNLSDLSSSSAARSNLGLGAETISTSNPTGGSDGDKWFKV